MDLENKHINKKWENFEKLFRLSPSPLCLTTKTEGVIIEVNEIFCQLVEYTKEELIGKTSTEIGLFPSHQARDDFFKQWNSIYSSEQHQLQFTNRSGKKKYILLSLTSLNYEENECYLYCYEDITQYRQQQIKLKKDNQMLQSLIKIDGLTEVANRRHFDEYIQQEWRRMLRPQTPISLILCDIDYFQRYNDTYGISSGDKCLKKVAQAIVSSLSRATDLVARYVEDEFAVILSDTNLEGAFKVAKKIRTKLGEAQLIHPNSDVSPYVTLSMGIGCLTPSLELKVNDLVTLTNRALIQAKNQGRDFIVTLIQ